MNCNSGDFSSDFGFTAHVAQTTSRFTSDSVSVHVGSEVYFWAPFSGTNVFIRGALNAYDAAGYSGYWQADLY